MTDGTATGRGIRALGTAGLVVGLLAPQLVSAPTSGASTVNPQVALAEELLVAAQDTSKPAAQRALDTARLALDARREHVDASLLPLLDQEARNLDTSQQLLDLGSPERTDTLAFAIEVAKMTTAWQAAAADLDLPSAAIEESTQQNLPSEAIAALVASEGGKLTQVETAELSTLDGLPGTAPIALAGFVEAFARFDAATETAYSTADGRLLHDMVSAFEAGALNTIDVEILGLADLKQTFGIDLGPVLKARTELLDLVVPLRDALAELSTTQQLSPGIDFQVAPILAIDLDLNEANTYTQDYMLQLDLGGDDTYLNNAGGASVVRDAAALVDLLGADQYRSGRSTGINGGGFAGSGLLVDAIGSDTYLAGSGGTNGGGWLGAGLLLDALSDNVFMAGDTGTNGGGSLGGVGMLVDLFAGSTMSAGSYGTNGGGYLAGVGSLVHGVGVDNSDVLTAGQSGTNGGGSSGGMGFMFDAAIGSDTYSAGTGGTNGGAGGDNSDQLDALGGVGFLFDADGQDTYSGGSRGVNGGGVVGVGMVVDGTGPDWFGAGASGVNGGAELAGAGFLINIEGNDRYFGSDRGANGGGNVGAGFLLDATGSDVYQAANFGGNGGGSLGVGALIDGGGSDSYASGAGGANGAGSFAAMGLLFDAEGTDFYSDNEPAAINGSGTDKTVFPKGNAGAGAQIDNPPPSPVPTTIPNVTTTSVPLPTTTLPSTTTSTLPEVTTSTLPPVTTTSVPLPTTTLPSTTTSTLPAVPPVVVIDFENTDPCTSHPINDDALLGIWHSPAADGLPISICVVVHFPIELRVRITLDPDALNA